MDTFGELMQYMHGKTLSWFNLLSECIEDAAKHENSLANASLVIDKVASVADHANYTPARLGAPATCSTVFIGEIKELFVPELQKRLKFTPVGSTVSIDALVDIALQIW